MRAHILKYLKNTGPLRARSFEQKPHVWLVLPELTQNPLHHDLECYLKSIFRESKGLL